MTSTSTRFAPSSLSLLIADTTQFVEKHRLPVFSGVVLSLSGITDIARRTEINKLLTRQQGVYVKNVERPVKITHLLCAGDEETDKMRCAEKFNKKGEANIHLIWEEWFWDCLEFGGKLSTLMHATGLLTDY
jgi:DNA replication regulator DPB11